MLRRTEQGGTAVETVILSAVIGIIISAVVIRFAVKSAVSSALDDYSTEISRAIISAQKGEVYVSDKNRKIIARQPKL
jgi:Flp pilus assembly pilin Flp